MSKHLPPPNEPARHPTSSISSSTLADFLMGLATLLSAAELGNQALASALGELAICVRRGCVPGKRKSPLAIGSPARKPTADIATLSGLDRESVERFISDATKSKAELLDLAAARFSIPRSQLKRMKTTDVRK